MLSKEIKQYSLSVTKHKKAKCLNHDQYLPKTCQYLPTIDFSCQKHQLLMTEASETGEKYTKMWK